MGQNCGKVMELVMIRELFKSRHVTKLRQSYEISYDTRITPRFQDA